MKIVVYCQHVLGIGHFFRTLEICRALDRHDVILVTGGPKVVADIPDHIRCVHLPGLQMNSQFKGLHATASGKDLDTVKAERCRTLSALIDRERPDVLLLELYPFGRKAFRFEIDPILQSIRGKDPRKTAVVCSLRDILVDREDAPKYEARVLGTLNAYFDLLLVHGDPELIRLDETFSRIEDIRIPMVYTGYIAPRPHTGAGGRIREQMHIGPNERLIVASAGGGKVGERLLAAVLKARRRVREPRVTVQVFTGPYLDAAAFDRLQALGGPSRQVRIERFTDAFPAYLAAADLSVSMGGYNTTMNILAARTRALIWPFAQNQEQRLRGLRLMEKGILTLIDDRDLEADRLAGLITGSLGADRPAPVSLNLNGARNTAERLEQMAARIGFNQL